MTDAETIARAKLAIDLGLITGKFFMFRDALETLLNGADTTTRSHYMRALEISTTLRDGLIELHNSIFGTTLS